MSGPYRCLACDGIGLIETASLNDPDEVQRCPKCNGSGERWLETVFCPSQEDRDLGRVEYVNGKWRFKNGDIIDSSVSPLKCPGVGRDRDNISALQFYFSRRVTDDEMRFLHDVMKRAVACIPKKTSLRVVPMAWNGGSREAALAAASDATERAIASGCPRCGRCDGVGAIEDENQLLTACPDCGGAGFLIPPGGMPMPTGGSHG